jgi:tetratricopeptide (TPR) repeat protein
MSRSFGNFRRFAQLAALLAAVSGVTACAAPRYAPRATPVVRAMETRNLRELRAERGANESEAHFVERVRNLQANADSKARSGMMLPTAETNDPALRASLARLALAPTAANHRDVAAAYNPLKIHDMAYQHLSQAIKLERRDAAAYDARARLWRDLGLPHVALPDAHRAAYFASDSPIPQNTLGTVLEALGFVDLARARYQRALKLDPAAEYARFNYDRLARPVGTGKKSHTTGTGR